LATRLQEELIKSFVGGTTARSAALLTGVNRHTATLFFRKLREGIAERLNEEAPELLGGEVETDESDFGGRGKGGAALAARFPSSACSSGAARSIR
jgi:transposase